MLNDRYICTLIVNSFRIRYRNRLFTLRWVLTLSLFISAHIEAADQSDAQASSFPSKLSEQSIKTDFKNIIVLSKFKSLKEANDLLYSLEKSGQLVRLISREIAIKLKSLSIGLFPDKKEAEAVVRHLKKNKINAFVHQLKSGRFRVHAGALRSDIYYWQRYEKLRSLGYKKPMTSFTDATSTEYYIVKDRKDESTLSTLMQPIVKKIENSDFKTELNFARFKGEFSIWGEENARSSSNYFKAAVSLRTSYKKNVDLVIGSRFDAKEQSSEENLQKFEFQWMATYFRYHRPGQEWLMGGIDARWDSKNRESLSDQMSSKILTRYKLDNEIIDRRRPSFGFRWNFSNAEYGLNVIWLPIFRPAKLPDFGNIWHPVRRSNGVIRGIKSTDVWQQLIQAGSFADEKLDSGGVGVRMTKKVGNRLRAITLQFTRRSEPYYKLNPSVQQALIDGRSINFALSTDDAIFTPEHPYSGIFTWEESSKTANFEIAVLSNTPYTTENYKMKTAMSMHWKLGFVTPKTHRNTFISSYFEGYHINTADKILDRQTKVAISGELYQYTRNRHWKIGTAYEIGLDRVEVFLNPRIVFQQSKQVSLFVNYLLFTGDPATESGYHTQHSILSLTWQAKF